MVIMSFGIGMIQAKPCFSKIGEPGKRYALPNSSIMIHQPSGGASGQASDIAIHAREILRVRERLNRIFQKHTGIREIEAIGKWSEWASIQNVLTRALVFSPRRGCTEKMMERDYYMTAEEAMNFGLVDKVLEKRTEDTTKKDWE